MKIHAKKDFSYHGKLVLIQVNIIVCFMDSSIDHRYMYESLDSGGYGSAFFQELSGIDSHSFFFCPDSTSIWNQLPCYIRSCEDILSYSTTI